MLDGTNPHTPRGCAVKSKPRNYTIFLFLLTSIILASCGVGGGDINFSIPPISNNPLVSNTNFEAVKLFSAEVPVGNYTQFNLTGKGGVVTVTGISGATSVMISAIKRVQSVSIEDAEAHLQELNVNVQDLATEIRVETIQPIDDGGRNYIVDYTITLPIFLEVHVQNIGGIVTLDSINNDVTVINVGGNITLRNILGRALIDLVAGTIEGKVTLPLNGTIDMKTVTGDIHLAIPVNTSSEFSATVNLGSISDTNLVLQNEVRTSTFLSGTLGSGQGTITLETEVLGNISVSGF